MNYKSLLVCFSVLQVFSATAISPAWSEPISDIYSLSLEELMDVQVTSVAKREQSVGDSAAAIFVITPEDIRRSGATSVPEALRLVPGMHVAKINSSMWAIGARGFSELFSNKLLVLIDGRSVYTPFFSGVYWDVQDVVLEDIERIEVIRGPGATLWGANAVNGVINIITKHSSDTEGNLVSGGAGSEELGFGTVRHGGRINEDATYRVYAKHNSRDDSEAALGGDATDSWNFSQAGFRTDWNDDNKNIWNLQGDAYLGEKDSRETLVLPTAPFFFDQTSSVDMAGGNIILGWSRQLDERSQLNAKIYYDKTTRDYFQIDHQIDTFDSELEYRTIFSDVHSIVIGGGYRTYQYDLSPNIESIFYRTQKQNVDLLTWFAQDEISIIPDTLRLIVGSKFEDTEFSGFEYQPNIRAIWTPNKTHTLWTAISRAVRTPSIVEEDLNYLVDVRPTDSGLPAMIEISGDGQRDSEKLLAFELGYRGLLHEQMWFDISTFYNLYDEVGTVEAGAPEVILDSNPRVRVPLEFQSKAEGDTYGFETVITAQPTDWWKLVGSYTFFHHSVQLDSDSTDTFAKNEEDAFPKNQFLIRSLVDLPYNLEFDTALRYVDAVNNLSAGSYSELDARLGWRVQKGLELSLVGQNLLSSSHKEAQTPFIPYEETRIERAVFAKATFTF